MNKNKIIALFLVVLLLSPVMVLAQTVTSLDEITSTTVDNTQTTGTPVTESPTTTTAPDTSSSTTTTKTEVTVQETPAPVTPVKPVDKSTGELVGDIFGGLAPDDASLGRAGVVLAPMLDALQTYLSYAILIIIGLQVFLISIDLVFLGFPFVRGFLLKSLEDGSLSNSASNIAQGGMSPMGGMGMSPMGGMGIGMGRMGGYGGYGGSRFGGRMGMGMGMNPPMAMGGGLGGYGSPQVSTPFGELAKSRFISDSAVSAFFESMDALQAGAVQSLNPMSGMGAGGQQVSSKSPKFKDMISIYIRRHAWFIILFSATLIIFTSPVLFQLGFKLGQFIINALGSLV